MYANKNNKISIHNNDIDFMSEFENGNFHYKRKIKSWKWKITIFQWNNRINENLLRRLEQYFYQSLKMIYWYKF